MATCLVCKKEYYPKNKKRATKYCSRECFYKGNTGHPATNPMKRTKKQCEACGKWFETGGRLGHDSKKYCSRECAGHGGIRLSEPKQLTEEQAAYLAGFFDGEGSIIQVHGHGWRITIYQSWREIIEWVMEVTGTGTTGQRNPTTSNIINHGPLKTQYWWNLYGKNAALLLEQLLPYMIVKKSRALECINSIRGNV